MQTCPLCETQQVEHYLKDKRRTFHQCQVCHLVFVDPNYLPSPSQEKQEYSLHQNQFDDPGYRQFLAKVATPLLPRLNGSTKGLDFGCGPGPVLAAMIEEAGHQVTLYDPLFVDEPDALSQKYDFVTCTEAIEHFHQPRKEWEMFMNLLKPNGILAIMTKRVLSKARFANWHYKNDMTHVSFFSEETFHWLAKAYSLELEIISDDVVFFTLKSPALIE